MADPLQPPYLPPLRICLIPLAVFTASINLVEWLSKMLPLMLLLLMLHTARSSIAME